MNPLSLLTGPWGYVLAALGAAALAIWLTVAVKDHEIDGMKLAQAQAAGDAWKIGWLRRDIQDRATVAANTSNAVTQAALNNNTQEIIRYVPKYITVKDDAACVLPWGFVRLLDSAGLGIAPDQLPNGTGEPDSAPSGIPLSQATALLAQALGDRATLAARVLNAKQAWADAASAANAVPPKKPSWLERNNPF